MLRLETDRLILRPFEPTDFDAVHAYGSDPDVTRYTSFGPNTEEETRGFLETCVDGMARAAATSPEAHVETDSLDWAITLRDGDSLIGGCGLRGGLPGSGELETGYVLNRGHWRRGFGREAVEALRDFAFGPLGARRVFARIFPANAGSIALIESLGFVREGVRRRDFFVRGAWEDAAVYAQLADDPR